MHEKKVHHKPVIVLDAGKVLVDFDINLFFAGLSKLTGREITPTLSPDLDELYLPMEVGARSLEEVIRVLNKTFCLSLENDQWRKLWCRVFLGEVSGMREVLSELKDHFRLVALSNTIELHWTFILKKYPIFNLLDGWVVSYKEGVVKPNSAIYKVVEERYCNGGTPFFYTDDTEKNIDAARQLGWEAEVFCGAAHFKEEVRKRCRSGNCNLYRS